MDQSRRSADPTGWHEPPQHVAPPIHFGLPHPEDPGPAMNDAGPALNARVDDDDLDLLAEVNRKPSRTTAVLLIGILTTLTFIGGVVVQKQYGGTAASGTPAAAAGGFGARAGGNANFAGGGGFPGGGAAGGAAPGGAAGGTAAGGTAGGGTTGRTTAATAPVVVGTVTKLSGNSLTVKNLGGKSVKVNVKEGATITLVAGKTLTTLKSGATVSVVGTTGTDGTVTATAITVRS